MPEKYNTDNINIIENQWLEIIKNYPKYEIIKDWNIKIKIICNINEDECDKILENYIKENKKFH